MPGKAKHDPTIRTKSGTPKRGKPKPKNKKANRTSGAGGRKPKPSPFFCARSERLDMRLTKAEKAKIIAKAKKTRRTVTSLVIEAIEKIK